MDFIFYKIPLGFMMTIVSLLALLNEIITNPQILFKSQSPWSIHQHNEGHRMDTSRKLLKRIKLYFQTFLLSVWLLEVEGNSEDFLLLLYKI